MRLAVRIPLLSVGAVLITGLAAATISGVLGQHAVRQAAFAATEAGAEAYASAVEHHIGQATAVLDSFSRLDPVTRTWSHEGLAAPDAQDAIRIALSRSMASLDRFEYVALVHPDGEVFLVEPVALQAQLSRPDVAYLSWFTRLVSTGTVVSDLFVSTITRHSSVVVGTTVHDAGGQKVGYLVGGLRLSAGSASRRRSASRLLWLSDRLPRPRCRPWAGSPARRVPD